MWKRVPMIDDWDKGPHMSLWIISNEVLDQLWHRALSWTCLLMINTSQTKSKGSIFSKLIVLWCFDIIVICFWWVWPRHLCQVCSNPLNLELWLNEHGLNMNYLRQYITQLIIFSNHDQWLKFLLKTKLVDLN
jgi:hypothetical protein